ncbi:hypothetical protein ACIRU8_44215 [Streptomyces sp. NPDC101175]|uniref:hypothetical protein n=1 Tax=Streptomyces sp. NPDC101175 TaxID=3366123 RepID=UPI0038346ABC
MKEEGTGGMGGAATAGDRGALSRLRVGRAAAPRRAAVSPAAEAGTEVAGVPVLSFRCRAPPRGEAGESRRMEVPL